MISLSAKGLTTGEVQAHLAEVADTEVSRQTISIRCWTWSRSAVGGAVDLAEVEGGRGEVQLAGRGAQAAA